MHKKFKTTIDSRVQDRVAPLPLWPYPALQVHVEADADDTLLLGHAGQDVAPAALYVLAPHAAQMPQKIDWPRAQLAYDECLPGPI